MSNNTLSVILPSYNHSKYIKKSIDSLLSQTRKAEEIIIIDDGSTDNSWEIIHSYSNRYKNIKAIKNEYNMGTIKTLLRGFYESNSEYVYFASSDDYTHENFFEKSLALLEEYPNAGYCSAFVYQISPSDKIKQVVPSPVVRLTQGYIPASMAKSLLKKYGSWFIGTSTIYNRNSLEKVGVLNTELAGYTDGFSSTVISLISGCCFIPEPLAYWRRGGNSYAINSFSDVDVATRMFNEFNYLMKNKYADLFDETLKNNINKRISYSIIQTFVSSNSNASAETLSKFMPKVSHIFITLLCWTMSKVRAGGFYASVMLLLRLRYQDIIPVLVTRARHIYLNKKDYKPV